MEITTNSGAGRKIIILDSTLRDGDQSARGTMYPSQKIKLAEQLERMNVDIIEAGFAISSRENFETMQNLYGLVRNSYVSGLCRSRCEDIDATYEAFKKFDKKMVHVFLPTSEVQVQSKMRKTEDELIQIAANSVKYAKDRFELVEFTAEDAVRTNLDFLKRVYKTAIESGATTINLPDTVGCAFPQSFGKLVYEIKNYINSINPKVKLSVHCHNDLGMATANTIAGIENGADQVEVTINGLGERAGNCSLEQIVAASIVRPEMFITNIDPSQMYEASKMVSQYTGIKNPLAPIVGDVCFSHKSGIHQHGVINNRVSYEIVDPQVLGRKTEIIIGPHSGYHGMMAKAKEFGIEINKDQADRAIEIVSEMVRMEKQKRFSDDDIRRILTELKLVAAF